MSTSSISLPSLISVLKHLVLISQLCLVFLMQTLSHSTHPRVLVVSFDGFRHDYLDMVKHANKITPNFDYFVQNGVRAKWVQGSYVTKTFPSHFSIATGSYEETHGVVANEFYDPEFDEVFGIEDDNIKNDPKWWNNGTKDGGSQPIWITNELAHKDLFTPRSGVFFWPGSETTYSGKRPHHYRIYDKTIEFETRIDTVVDWFRTEEDPINFGMVYFNEPDHLGHRVGPDAPEILDKVVELDKLVGHLLDKLREAHLLDHVNLILTSDHGMASLSADRLIGLDEHIDPSLYTRYGDKIISHILPIDGKEDEVYEQLRSIEHLHVYKKDEIPREFHYTYNRRIMPILIEAEEGWSIVRNTSYEFEEGGSHGYNNSLMSMHPFFLATGPAFRHGVTVEPFESVDIYPLLCHILKIPPAKHEGQLERVLSLLATDEDEDEDEEHGGMMDYIFDVTMVTYLLVAVFAATVSGVCCIAACRVYRVTRRRTRILHLPLDTMNDTKRHLLASDEEEEELP